MENENWQRDWAHITLDVILKVSSKQGLRLYGSDTAPREDLQSYLTLEAQKIANRYQPNWEVPTPCGYWAAYLHKALTDTARYHWDVWIGVSSTNPAQYEAAKQANQGWARIEHILNKDDQVIQVEQRMTPVGGTRILSPEDHYIRIETLRERINDVDHETIPNILLCIENNCTRTRSGLKPRCSYHHKIYRSLWEEGERCKQPHCPDRAVGRGYCITHYGSFVSREKRAGTWEPTSPVQMSCTIDGCTNAHKGRGYCQKHLAQQRAQGAVELPPRANEPCAIKDCDATPVAKGFCQRHYQQMRKAINPPCVEQDCDSPQVTKKLCSKHYRQAREALRPPCTIEGCDTPSLAKGLCNKHYLRKKKGQP